MNPQNKRLIIILFSVVLLLSIPFIAMQFTGEMNWSPFDFLVMGILLPGIGLTIELAFRRIKNLKQRIILFAVILGTSFLI